jgi:hypothetical protein
LVIDSDNGQGLRQVEWVPPSPRQRGAWNNRDDATRDGAYCVCAAAVEAESGWVTVDRAETRTGADYYIAPAGQAADLEVAQRLEVSGVDESEPSVVAHRLTEKIRQARRGDSTLPAVAAVVGFKAALVLIRPVETGDG